MIKRLNESCFRQFVVFQAAATSTIMGLEMKGSMIWVILKDLLHIILIGRKYTLNDDFNSHIILIKHKYALELLMWYT